MECQRFTPGHVVHPIQALRKHRMPGEIKQVSVLGHEGNWLILEMDDAALQRPHTALYYTSTDVLVVRDENGYPHLYPKWDGPDECAAHGDLGTMGGGFLRL